MTATVVAGAAVRVSLLYRCAVDHRLQQLATRIEANARGLDSRDAAAALRYAARELRRELETLSEVTA
ncbi:hypothetical protein [Dietzia kunjamensis]|uniref:hypothetical protein n=1 Tax=Dietzia kunjamensis TaxID=322509 RepID=UPI0039BC2294